MEVKDKTGKIIKVGNYIQYDNDEKTMSKWTCGEVALIIKDDDGVIKARMSPFDEKTGCNQNILTKEFEDCCEIIDKPKD